MGTLMSLDSDRINQSMCRGLVEAFKAELAEYLSAQMRTIINDTCEKVSRRLELRLMEGWDPLMRGRTLNLTWLIKEEKNDLG